MRKISALISDVADNPILLGLAIGTAVGLIMMFTIDAITRGTRHITCRTVAGAMIEADVEAYTLDRGWFTYTMESGQTITAQVNLCFIGKQK